MDTDRRIVDINGVPVVINMNVKAAFDAVKEAMADIGTSPAELIADLQKVLNDPEHHGLILEDEYEMTSLTIDSEYTIASIEEKGVFAISTMLLLNMLENVRPGSA